MLEEVLGDWRKCRRRRGSGGSALGRCYVLGRWSKCFEGGWGVEVLGDWRKY